jgi:glycosyltransferase involved in cell wall biosynthesis
MLRVLFVAPVAVEGGAGQVLLNLVTEAPHGGYEPHVVWLEDGPLVGELARLGGDGTLLPAGRLRSPVADVRTFRALLALIRRIGPSLVFATEAKGHVYSALPAKRAGLPALWRQPSRPSARSPIDMIATALPAECVVVASEDVAAAQRALPFGPPIRVVPPGIDPERYAAGDGHRLRIQHGLSSDCVVVGIVGRLQPWKGQDIFLRAAALVARVRPEVRYALIGGAEMGWEEGDFPGELKRLAQSLGLTERVVFTGQTQEVPHWLGALDICVNVSDREPFGLVILEAMAAGTPVIAVAAGGPAEIIEHGETGVLLARRTPEALARALLGLVAAPAERRRLSDNALLVVRTRYSSTRMAADVGELMRQVCRPPTGSELAATPQ